MKEYAVNSSDNTPTPTPEPNFDDEQTLLSARPVVPLEQIKAKTRQRRLWVLSGAFTLAMLLGAASALLASYLKQRNVPQTATELIIEADVAAEPPIVAENASGETPAVENESLESSEPEISEEVTLSVTPKRESVTKRRTVAPRHSAHPDERRDTREVSEEDELQRIREAVLYDQWQERRARRATQRERRRAERDNHRDLSDLNEIFEGRGRRRP